jgi:CheY-like chemotaxis protein
VTARTDPSDPHQDLAGVLHDVSNALTVLLGWVGEAREPGATPEAVAYALTIIEQRARIARDLARHAIGSARIDEQRQVGAIAEELAQALRIEAHRAGVALVVSGAESPARVAGALDFSQVLTNLVLNALAYAPAASTVALSLDVSEDSVTVTVKDQGPGVAPERHDSIFEGDTQRPGGTGVGLRHARDLARSRGGDVTLAASVRGERGATFHMFWPRVDAVPRPPVSASRFSDLTGLRVLVVEDDPAVTQLLEAALDARGAVVTVARTRASFDAALARGAYDAALVDLSPIAADPAGALASFRARCPAANVVLITGQADALPEAVLAERVELVRKPFELREILAAIVRKRA